MKTKKELSDLKEEVETMNEKLHELTDEELAQVVGGAPYGKVPVTVVTGGKYVMGAAVAIATGGITAKVPTGTAGVDTSTAEEIVTNLPEVL